MSNNPDPRWLAMQSKKGGSSKKSVKSKQNKKPDPNLFCYDCGKTGYTKIDCFCN